MKQSASAAWALAPVVASDFEALLALRLRAMRESLTQLGRYDEERARARLAEGFVPANTHHIDVQGQRVGFLVLKRLSHALRLDHFYIDPPWQNRGMGANDLGQALGQEQQQIQQTGGGGLLNSVLDRDGDGDVDATDLMQAGLSAINMFGRRA